jgi:thiol:disulfide interchange protein
MRVIKLGKPARLGKSDRLGEPGVGGRRRLGLLFGLMAVLAGIFSPTPRAQAQIGFPGGPVDAVKVRVVPQQSTVAPGDQLPIAVVFDFQEGFHSWTNPPIIPPQFGEDFPAIPTTVDPASVPKGVLIGDVQWPEGQAVRVNYGTGPIDLMSYTGQTVAFVPVIVGQDVASGETALDLNIGYQVCDETTCYPPETQTVRVPLRVAAAGSETGAGSGAGTLSPADAALFAGFDPTVVTDGVAVPAACSDLSVNFFGRTFAFCPTGASGLGLLLLVAAIGGILLNFTPCVLPVLPLKVMALSRAAGNPRRLALLGLCMSLGVVMFWLAIGGAIAFIAGFSAISSLFQTGWFALGVGIFVAIMAIGMLGLFEFNPPRWAYQVNPSQDTLQGSFLFGVLAAVLSTPCTAPFMGSAAAWAATQEPPITLATFAAIGIGMALPYMLLSLRPKWVHAVPRSGPGSVLVKQVMGLFMLAVAAFFAGTALSTWLSQPPEPASRDYWYVVIFFIVLACTWMIYGTFRITHSTGKRLVFSGIGLAVMLVSVRMVGGLASQGPIDWVYFTPERFAEAQNRGDVVVMDFTAEWCLNCKVLEAGVLHQPEIVDLLDQPGVTPMKVDLTGSNPEGQAMLSALKWVGIPLLAVFGPATGYEDPPLKYDSYTIDTVKEAVDQARAVSEAGAR